MHSLNNAFTVAAAIAAPPLVDLITILEKLLLSNFCLLFSTPINPTGIPIIKLGNFCEPSKRSSKLSSAVGELPITIIGDLVPKFLADNLVQPLINPYAVLVNLRSFFS